MNRVRINTSTWPWSSMLLGSCGYPLQAACNTAIELVKKCSIPETIFPSFPLPMTSSPISTVQGWMKRENGKRNVGYPDREPRHHRPCRRLVRGRTAADRGDGRRSLLSNPYHPALGWSCKPEILEPDVLATHAGEMRDRGIYTTTVGIGDNYSITQLQVLAEAEADGYMMPSIPMKSQRSSWPNWVRSEIPLPRILSSSSMGRTTPPSMSWKAVRFNGKRRASVQNWDPRW